MKSKHHKTQNSRAGSVAIGLMAVCLGIATIVGVYIKFSTQNCFMTRRALDYQQARILAESALSAAEVQTRRLVEELQLNISTQLIRNRFRNQPKPAFSASNAMYRLTYYDILPHSTAPVSVTDDEQQLELMNVDLIAGVSNTLSGITAAFKKTISVQSKPFCRYAIFYEGGMEMHPGPRMEVHGDVRGNDWIKFWQLRKGIHFYGDLTGSSTVRFVKPKVAQGANDILRAARNVHMVTKTYTTQTVEQVESVRTNEVRQSFLYNNQVLSTDLPDWSSKSRKAWGSRVNIGYDVHPFRPPIGDLVEPRALLEPRRADDTARLRKTKFSHNASKRILVTKDNSVTVWHKNGNIAPRVNEITYLGEKDPLTGVYPTSNGWYKVHQEYFDPREDPRLEGKNSLSGSTAQKMTIIDIYLDKFQTIGYKYADSIYIYFEDRDDGTTPAVRLRNGHDITLSTPRPDGSHRGLTIATDRTLYIEGDFNSTADNALALIAADNITLLSNGWKDDQNTGRPEPYLHKAKTTTLNAAIMAGQLNADREDVFWTGGVQNLVRFREDWQDIDYNFNGSYLCMWDALESPCFLKTGSNGTFEPPNRNINFDPRFNTQSPPRIPKGYEVVPGLWKEISWQELKRLITQSNQPDQF